MKRRLLICVCLAALLTLITSCGLFDKPVNTPEGELAYTQIIYSDEDLNLVSVSNKMRSILGPTVKMGLASEVEEGYGEVVFGDSSRAITAKAKAALEKELSYSDEYDCGYIIYAEGGSIAVYWQIADMADIAVQKFVDVCLDEKRLVLEEGTVACEQYELREYEKEKHWLTLEAVAEPDVVSALRRLYNYYEGTKLIEWMANLYDPDRGGFYYSRSARDHEPYLPDIESTYQIMNVLQSGGAISNKGSDLPEELKVAMLEFVRSTQSAEDGYFYHEQWPQGRENLATDRYGRDLSWATSLINTIDLDTDGDGVYEDQYPLYCAPNGYKCEKHVNTDDTCSFPIVSTYYTKSFSSAATVTLREGVSAAVSKASSSYVKAVAVDSHPDYSSRAAFSAWLEEYNATIKENSGKAHNISALRGEIKQKGYHDIVLAHLMRVQGEVYQEQLAAGETPTGMWQRNVDFNAVWGLLKYAGYYNDSELGAKIDIKYVPYMVRTAIKVVEMPPDGNYESWDLYNQWSSIGNLITNVKRHYGDEGLEIIYEIYRESAASLVDKSLAKIEPFKRADGSFSSYSTGNSAASIYGVPISHGVTEGDVNSVHLITQMYKFVYTCLGYKQVPLFSKEDGVRFAEIALSSETIDKTKVEKNPADFEDGLIPDGIKPIFKSSGGAAEIVADPEDFGNSVLRFDSTTLASGRSDEIQVLTVTTGSNCYIFSGDMYIMGDSDNACLYQIQMGQAYMIDITKASNGTVKIRENSNITGSSIKRDLTTVKTEEWFSIRIEVYVPGESLNSLDRAQIKIWINEELIRVSDLYFGSEISGAQFKEDYGLTSVYAMRSVNAYCYLDNLYSLKEDRIFDATDDTIYDDF